jgi:hypothetical protein
LFRVLVERTVIEQKLAHARWRLNEHLPFSPAWDAAMAEVEDLELELWRLQVKPNTADLVSSPESQPIAVS